MKEKRCLVCKMVFASRSSIHVYCSAQCRGRAKRQRFSPKDKAYQREYQRKYRKGWVARNPSYHKKYREEHREICKKYQEQHREICNRQRRKWYANNRHKIKAWDAQRKAKLRSGRFGVLTPSDWLDILQQFGNACAYCRRPFGIRLKATMDHVLPLSLGGLHTKENVVPACRSCNSRKGASLHGSVSSK